MNLIVKKILDLLPAFVKNPKDIKIFSIKLLFDALGKDLELTKRNLLGGDYPSLQIFFPQDSIRFDFDDDLLGIPIFPPLLSPYGKLYLRMLDIYQNHKIDFIVVSREEFESLSTISHDGYEIVNFNAFIRKMKQEIDFKLSQVEKTSFFAFRDIYRNVMIMKNLIKLREDYLRDGVIDFFMYLDNKFGREFLFQGGNHTVDSYQGVARLIDKNTLHDFNKNLNEFNSGDIIVAENTSVSYMRYILKSGGIITMNNNILSHASIVSRELGLPLILGADFVYLKIFDGDLIEINPKTGAVYVVKRFWEYV